MYNIINSTSHSAVYHPASICGTPSAELCIDAGQYVAQSSQLISLTCVQVIGLTPTPQHLIHTHSCFNKQICLKYFEMSMAHWHRHLITMSTEGQWFKPAGCNTDGHVIVFLQVSFLLPKIRQSLSPGVP